jgi:hypothetical protein
MYVAMSPCTEIGNSSIASEKVDARRRALSARWKPQSRKDFVIDEATSSTLDHELLPERLAAFASILRPKDAVALPTKCGS